MPLLSSLIAGYEARSRWKWWADGCVLLNAQTEHFLGRYPGLFRQSINPSHSHFHPTRYLVNMAQNSASAHKPRYIPSPSSILCFQSRHFLPRNPNSPNKTDCWSLNLSQSDVRGHSPAISNARRYINKCTFLKSSTLQTQLQTKIINVYLLMAYTQNFP